MAEPDERVLALEGWCIELDEELRRLAVVLQAIGTVAHQAGFRVQD